MRLAVIGAGLAGIAAAREAGARGHEVVVFEKSRGVGGRVASRRIAGTVVDHGSPALTAAAGTSLATALAGLADGPPMHPVPEGCAAAAGAAAPLKALAAGIDVRRGVRVRALRASSAGLEIADEQGNVHGTADAAVVTAPGPQAADLLAASGEPAGRVAAVRAVAYAPAVMVLAGMAGAGPGGPVATAHPGPLAAVRVESDKGRAPVSGVAAVVARLADADAAELLEASDEAVLDRALPALAAAVAPAPAAPAWVQVKRWRFAVPRLAADIVAANPPGARIVLAGDLLAGTAFGARDHASVYATGVGAVDMAEAAAVAYVASPPGARAPHQPAEGTSTRPMRPSVSGRGPGRQMP